MLESINQDSIMGRVGELGIGAEDFEAGKELRGCLVSLDKAPKLFQGLFCSVWILEGLVQQGGEVRKGACDGECSIDCPGSRDAPLPLTTTFLFW